jgi:lipopolysaccharide export system permease protein
MIIARYLSGQIAISVVVVMFAFVGFQAFFDLKTELDELSKTYTYGQAISFVLLNTPSRIYELMPIGVLIGAIYAMAQLAGNSEFTAMRAAGLGRKEALLSISKLAIVFVLFTFCVGEFLAPPLERYSKQIKAGSSDRKVAQLRSGAWLKDTQRSTANAVVAQRFVNVKTLESDGSLSGIRVFEFDAAFRLRSVVTAELARYVRDGEWAFTNANITSYDERTINQTDSQLVAATKSQNAYAWKSELTPELFGVLAIDPDKMSAVRLWQYTAHLKENQQAAERYEIAMWRKVIYPFVTVVMLVLALPFAYLNVRSGGIGYKVSAGILLGITFHTLNSLFSHVGMLNTWPPWVAATTPSLLATALALFMLYWVDRA